MTAAVRTVLRALLSRWTLSFVVLVQAVLAVWFLGPLLSALEPAWTRLLLAGLLVLAWLVVNLLISWRRRRRDTALATGVAGPAPPDPALEAAAEERAEMAERLAAALSLLRKARGTRGYLYEQPWYAIIGPPGAGKTTALLNAGLRFPLAAELGQGAVAGVGGTRLCDWWFTDEAVLIDTAGRYTTQDSDPEVDRAGWEAFLDLLKSTRPRRPLNGAVAAISLADVARAPAEEGSGHARAVRRRVKELQDRLGLRLPVYAVFTKADLIAGFSEFFDDLDQERRGQVWGTTFPLGGGNSGDRGTTAGVVSLFPERFRALVARLDEHLLERLQAERSPERRALIAGFPAQVASLEQPLIEFLGEAFGGSRLDPAPNLRGAYLTSGTQEGTPFDRLTGALARAFGVDQRRAPSLAPEKGRGYFLHRLLEGVIFREAMLASSRPGETRRLWLLRSAGYAAALAMLLGGGGLLLSERSAAQHEVEGMDAALAEYDRIARGVPLDSVADADFPRVLPLLDAARTLPHGFEQGSKSSAWWPSFGLGQEAKLSAGARAVYRSALQRVLLPRLVWRLETQMRANLGRPDFLYEATRVYLMLGGRGPLDRDLMRAWVAQDWQNQYPGPATEPMRAALRQHLDALLADPLPSIELDGTLVAQAQTAFSRVPAAARAYSRIRLSAAVQSLPPWRPADALGAAGADAFVRASGKSLTDGIPGFLTVEGFHRVLLPALGGAAAGIASESWVLGQKEEIQPGTPQIRALERDVIALYVADFAKEWDAMLADLNVAPLRSAAQAAQLLYILGSPQSPMRDLLNSIVRQLTLSVPPVPPAGAADKAQGAPGQAAAQQPAQATATSAPPEAPPPGKAVDDRYKSLREAVVGGPGSLLDQALRPLNALQQQLAQLAAAPSGSGAPAPGSDDPIAALRAEATRQPQPIARWLQIIAAGGTALRGSGSRQQVIAAYNATGGPGAMCREAAANRYPFVPSATEEIPLFNFAKLFAPGEGFDRFFNEQLRPFVDDAVTPWRAQEVAGVPSPVQPRDLEQFRRARLIRDAFFSGGKELTVEFYITPERLDPGARLVLLDLGLDQPIRYVSGPPGTTRVIWPGASRMLRVRLTFDPPPMTGEQALTKTGDWALFKLFGRGSVQRQSASERYLVTWNLGEREATFNVRAGSVQNPLIPGLLQGFQCPTLQ